MISEWLLHKCIFLFSFFSFTPHFKISHTDVQAESAYLHITVLYQVGERAGGSSTIRPQINLRDPTRNLSGARSKKRKRKKDLTGAECMRIWCILTERRESPDGLTDTPLSLSLSSLRFPGGLASNKS
ncbi:hypothetical protein BP00DRAFT_28690 [Aspergillus indologenus CBS 114.80]|uniref:Secreted protein n=1 Tax=Aspergillus indologenus CBS 114.80 TaxID=1450541 RepID=A0A2V5J1Y1_9EURO|nr:hypothetical protein BP00DRAFT_28690 [Aspergillus indologenus CBS 114.80]